ncbi:uncharacterized protein EI90DRAFT_3289687 [Cantharellus anzutake]|uniref:uncharacterized protein n=1 Tax=Cantharellus anzutake TaxID=1750568 RepID=UPI001907B483|nr:uncharacterized protein EI90DRAFT_3289687 [Cantharellus anzutake]KAF8330818.1 hypothetical protein EI90DRAFT_3289687 [Cantharellus anzutake]
MDNAVTAAFDLYAKFSARPEWCHDLWKAVLSQIQRIQSAQFICNVANRLTESADLPMEAQFSKWLDLGGRNEMIQSPCNYFRSLASRRLVMICKVFRDCFSGGSPLPTEDSSLEGKVGSERVNPANHTFLAIMSRITAWNFSHAKVELQLTPKQISVSPSHDETRPNAEVELEAFTTSFLERQLDVQEADLVADILRGINGKFLKGGLKRLTQFLNDFVSPPSVSISSQAGEVLRLLANVLRPLHYNPGSVPTLDPSKALKLIRPQRSNQEGGRSLLVPTNDLLQLVLLLVRMLQFEIVFRSVKTPIAREIADKRFAMRSVPRNNETYPFFFNPFPRYPRHSFPTEPTDWYTANLFHARAAFSSNPTRLILGDPVQARPWEWVEFTGAPPTAQTSSRRINEDVDIKDLNMSALSLEHFVVRVTGEKIQGSNSKEDENMQDLMERRRSEDHFYSESVYERDWKEEGSAQIGINH